MCTQRQAAVSSPGDIAKSLRARRNISLLDAGQGIAPTPRRGTVISSRGLRHLCSGIER